MGDINEREHPWAAHVAIDKDSFKPKEYAALLQAMDYMWRIPEERTKIILAAEFAEQNRADMLQNLNHENLWRMPKKDAVLLEKAQDAPPEKILIRYTDDLNRALSSPAGAASLLGVVILANDLKAQVLDDKRNPHTITLHATLSHEFHHLCDPAILNIGRYAPAIQEDAVIAHNALLDAKHYNVAYIREGHATKPPQALQDAVDKGKNEEVERYIQNVIRNPEHGNHAITNFLDERILEEALKYAKEVTEEKKDYRIIEADDTMYMRLHSVPKRIWVRTKTTIAQDLSH